MKNVLSPFAKLVTVAICVLTLGSCSRAEYAILPQGGSYHGVTRAATPVPARAATPATKAEVIATEAGTAAAIAPAAPVPVVAATPAAAQETPAAVVARPAAVPAHKLSLVQRAVLSKMTRKGNKLLQKTTARPHDNTAATTRGGISGNLRTGIILLLVGLLVGILNSLIGTVIAIIGIIFIILWVLDQL